jgi:hypothetical protein
MLGRRSRGEYAMRTTGRGNATGKRREQITRRYWGINSKTYLVECVERTVGGFLTTWRGETYVRRPAPRQGDCRDQVSILFGLRDLEIVDEVAFGTSAERSTRQKLEDLSRRYRQQNGTS